MHYNLRKKMPLYFTLLLTISYIDKAKIIPFLRNIGRLSIVVLGQAGRTTYDPLLNVVRSVASALGSFTSNDYSTSAALARNPTIAITTESA